MFIKLIDYIIRNTNVHDSKWYVNNRRSPAAYVPCAQEREIGLRAEGEAWTLFLALMSITATCDLIYAAHIFFTSSAIIQNALRERLYKSRRCDKISAKKNVGGRRHCASLFPRSPKYEYASREASSYLENRYRWLSGITSFLGGRL